MGIFSKWSKSGYKKDQSIICYQVFYLATPWPSQKTNDSKRPTILQKLVYIFAIQGKILGRGNFEVCFLINEY